jgi:hypothetical protein
MFFSIEDFDIPITISHPINKPLLLNCPLTNSWRHRYHTHPPLFSSYLILSRENSIHQYILPNNSLYIPHTNFNEIHGEYQCGSKQYNIQFYSKSSFSLNLKVKFSF